MKKRLILFKGIYDTLDLFITEFQLVYKNLGYDVLMFDTKNFSNSLLQLSTFAHSTVDAMITFNNLGLNFEFEAGRNLWNDLGIPCINILVDHPFHYHEALLQSPVNCTVVCMDKNHVSYIKRFYPNIKNCYFLPHGGTASPEIYLWENREIDVLYAGGLSKDFAQHLKPESDEIGIINVDAISHEVIDFLIHNPQYTTENILEQYLLATGIKLLDETLRLLIYRLRFIDSIVVSHFREKSIQVLVENGIHVNLYGNGWQNCSWIHNPNVAYSQRISPTDIFSLMGHSKIILNTMTWFKDGCHDRVFNGMMSKGISVTDSSIYMKENFIVGKELVLFELSQLDALPELVHHYLSHANLSKDIAQNAYSNTINQHSWSNRAMEILQYIS